jgi:hypothetical protein
MVWKIIPDRIPLQSLDLLRDDSEIPLPHTPIPLVPQQDEVFFAFIQTSHFILRLDFVADAFHNETLYHVFEVFIQESHPDSQESKTNPPSIPPFSLPTDQDGQMIHPSHRYNQYRIRFYASTQVIHNDFVYTFYSEDNIVVFRRGRFGDEWEIEIPPQKHTLSHLTVLLTDLPISNRTLHLLQQELHNQWNQFIEDSKQYSSNYLDDYYNEDENQEEYNYANDDDYWNQQFYNEQVRTALGQFDPSEEF